MWLRRVAPAVEIWCGADGPAVCLRERRCTAAELLHPSSSPSGSSGSLNPDSPARTSTSAMYRHREEDGLRRMVPLGLEDRSPGLVRLPSGLRVLLPQPAETGLVRRDSGLKVLHPSPSKERLSSRSPDAARKTPGFRDEEEADGWFQLGVEYVDGEGERVARPMDFSRRNRMTVTDLQRLHVKVLRPDLPEGGPGLGLDESDRMWLTEVMVRAVASPRLASAPAAPLASSCGGTLPLNLT